MSLRKQVDERDELIQYLREQYVKAVGQDIPVPAKWEGMVGLPVGPYVAGSRPSKSLENSFAQSIAQLNLPKPQTKKGIRDSQKKKENLDETHPAYHVHSISLTHFKDKEVKKEDFQNLLHTAKDLPRLFLLDLADNGLNDTFTKELEELPNFKRLKRLNLCENQLGKTALLQVVELLKGESILEWLDVSYNPFGGDSTAVLGLGNAVKTSQNLFHLRVSIGEGSSDQFVRYVLANKKLTSLCLPNSKLTPGAYSTIFQSLGDKKVVSHLSALDFSSSFLQKPTIAQLSEALKHNRSIAKLDLSGNGITSEVGKLLSDALDFNFSISILSLANNELSDTFAKSFARMLKNNQILWKCDLSGNPFTDEGAVAIQAVLSCENTTLATLGNMDNDHSISVLVREEMNSLLMSRTTGIRAGTIGSAGDYALLRPIEDTNANEDPEWQPWNLLSEVRF